MKTRAAIAVKRGEPLRLEEVELAGPGRGEVRVRIEACGICRSDLHALEGTEDVKLPAILGHEACGIVEEVGGGVVSPREGEHVILSWTPACGSCPSCRRQQVHLCDGITMSAGESGPARWQGRNLDRFMGLGAFAERVVVPARMAVPYRGEIRPEHACLIGCAAMTGFGAAAKTASVRWGDTVAILGCGGVGLAAVQGARLAGAAEVLAIDPLAERRAAAAKVGATRELAAEGAVAAVLEEVPGGVDVAIECVGTPDAMREAFLMVRPGGRAIVVGLPELRAKLELPAILLLREKSIQGSIYGSANPPVDFPRLVRLHEQGRFDLATLAGTVLSFSEINEGLEMTRAGSTTRVVLSFPRDHRA